MGQRIKTTTRRGRRRKTGGSSGYVMCLRCRGTGRVKQGGNRRK